VVSGAIFEVALFTQAESLRACALAEVAAVIGGVLRGFRWLQVTGSLKPDGLSISILLKLPDRHTFAD
jgi:hypothetical protein